MTLAAMFFYLFAAVTVAAGFMVIAAGTRCMPCCS